MKWVLRVVAQLGDVCTGECEPSQEAAEGPCELCNQYENVWRSCSESHDWGPDVARTKWAPVFIGMLKQAVVCDLICGQSRSVTRSKHCRGHDNKHMRAAQHETHGVHVHIRADAYRVSACNATKLVLEATAWRTRLVSMEKRCHSAPGTLLCECSITSNGSKQVGIGGGIEGGGGENVVGVT